MNAALKETLYDTYQKDYNAIKPEVQDLSYIFRCFDTGDDEQYQLTILNRGISHDLSLQDQYYKAIDSIDDESRIPSIHKKRVLKEAISLWYKSSNWLITMLLGEFILDQLKGEIWHHGLFEKDYFVWESIVLGSDYNEYLETIS